MTISQITCKLIQHLPISISLLQQASTMCNLHGTMESPGNREPGCGLGSSSSEWSQELILNKYVLKEWVQNSTCCRYTQDAEDHRRVISPGLEVLGGGGRGPMYVSLWRIDSRVAKIESWRNGNWDWEGGRGRQREMSLEKVQIKERTDIWNRKIRHATVPGWSIWSVREMLRKEPAVRSRATLRRQSFVLFSTDSREPPRKLN